MGSQNILWKVFSIRLPLNEIIYKRNCGLYSKTNASIRILLALSNIQDIYNNSGCRQKGVRCQVRRSDIPASHGKARDYSHSWSSFFSPFSSTASVRFLEIHSFRPAPPLGLIYMTGLATVASHITQGKWGSVFTSEFWHFKSLVSLLCNIGLANCIASSLY